MHTNIKSRQGTPDQVAVWATLFEVEGSTTVHCTPLNSGRFAVHGELDCSYVDGATQTRIIEMDQLAHWLVNDDYLFCVNCEIDVAGPWCELSYETSAMYNGVIRWLKMFLKYNTTQSVTSIPDAERWYEVAWFAKVTKVVAQCYAKRAGAKLSSTIVDAFYQAEKLLQTPVFEEQRRSIMCTHGIDMMDLDNSELAPTKNIEQVLKTVERKWVLGPMSNAHNVHGNIYSRPKDVRNSRVTPLHTEWLLIVADQIVVVEDAFANCVEEVRRADAWAAPYEGKDAVAFRIPENAVNFANFELLEVDGSIDPCEIKYALDHCGGDLEHYRELAQAFNRTSN